MRPGRVRIGRRKLGVDRAGLFAREHPLERPAGPLVGPVEVAPLEGGLPEGQGPGEGAALLLEDRPEEAEIRLLQMPGMRKDVASIDSRATLAEAQALLDDSSAEALCVRRTTAPFIAPVLGVVTQEDIDSFSQVS